MSVWNCNRNREKQTSQEIRGQCYEDHKSKAVWRMSWSLFPGTYYIATLYICIKFSFTVIISKLILIPKTNKNCLDIFQPLLQVYLLLPCLISRMSCLKSSNATRLSEFFTGSLQTYSIVSSVVSLAWSFSMYEANQKKGALDFSSNPIARIVILLSALMQVIHEKYMLILFQRPQIVPRKMRVKGLKQKFWGFNQIIYLSMLLCF